MAETVTLTTPVVYPSNTAYHLERLTIDFDAGSINIQLIGANGESLSVTYGPTTVPTGATLISQLNTANLSATSLVKRIYNRLVTDGFLVGTVSGTPT